MTSSSGGPKRSTALRKERMPDSQTETTTVAQELVPTSTTPVMDSIINGNRDASELSTVELVSAYREADMQTLILDFKKGVLDDLKLAVVSEMALRLDPDIIQKMTEQDAAPVESETEIAA